MPFQTDQLAILFKRSLVRAEPNAEGYDFPIGQAFPGSVRSTIMIETKANR